MASRTVAWSVLSSLGIDRMYCLLPTRRREKPEPRGSRDFTARRISSLIRRIDTVSDQIRFQVWGEMHTQ